MKFLPIIGLLAPPVAVLTLMLLNSEGLVMLGFSGDSIYVTTGIFSGAVWIWALLEGRSVNKFLKKDNKGNFQMAFGINSLSNILAIIIWWVSPLLLTNLFISAAITLVIMLIISNALRLWLTKHLFKYDTSRAANANKYVFIEEVLIYGLAISYFAFLGGAFR
jgi:hypothetical protein